MALRVPYVGRGAGSSSPVTIAPESAISTRARSGTARSTGRHGDRRDAPVSDLVDVQVGVGDGLTTAAAGQLGDVALVEVRAGADSARDNGWNAVETLDTSDELTVDALVGTSAVGERRIGGLALPPASSAMVITTVVVSDDDIGGM
ncbi:Uncharacterized protein PBTT_08023 [Plasmodiophora brassicae]